jgi:seryl-tRNA synthetase
MLTINLIREKKEFIIERLKVKNFEAEEIINRILALDSSRREIQSKTDINAGRYEPYLQRDRHPDERW